MCRICTDPLDELVKLIGLDCAGCSHLTAIPSELVNLKVLRCYGCPSLATIPDTLVNLTDLNCSRCPLLAAIPSTLTRLTTLFCARCPLLRAIPDTLVRVIDLCCSHCPLLVSIPAAFASSASVPCPRWHLVPFTPPHYPPRVECHGCPWLPQNVNSHPNHMPSLLRLQRWFRTGRKQTFKRWIRTRAFNEWIFHPDRIGGKLVKRQMEAELGQMRPTKKQRVE